MPLDLTTPVEVPPSDAIVYDKMWLQYFQVIGKNPNTAVTVKARCCPMRIIAPGGTRKDGTISQTGEMELYEDGAKDVSILDLFQDPIMAEQISQQTMGGLLTLVRTKAGL